MRIHATSIIHFLGKNAKLVHAKANIFEIVNLKLCTRN